MAANDIHIFLYSGKEILPLFSDGMYRVTVEGNNYCSSTLQGLIDAVGFFHSVYITTDPVVVPERPLAERLGEVLASICSLEDKQKAYFRLCALAADGNSTAAQIVSEIKGRSVSFGASCVAAWAGKRDFAEVTSTDIAELVADVVHRKELLNELSNKISLKSFRSKEPASAI